MRTQVCEPGVYDFPEAADALVPVLVVPGLGLKCTSGGLGGREDRLRSVVPDHMGNDAYISTAKVMMQARVLQMAYEEGWTPEQTAHWRAYAAARDASHLLYGFPASHWNVNPLSLWPETSAVNRDR